MSFMQNEQKNKTNRQLKVTVCHIKASAEITSFSQTLSVLYRSQMICIFILLCLHLKMYLSLAWVITVHRHTSVRTVILVHTCLSRLTTSPVRFWSSFLLDHEWKGEDRETGAAETADAFFIKVLWTLQEAWWKSGWKRAGHYCVLRFVL